ncbi:hypothetical protein [Gimesia maris]|uniref:Tetratricopeptide repeat protein n=1 Tax=Gimesia maris TaxID=122 RepID=A0ABX5YJV2_9PLAN|nr:hypothetical protein [Gimesia maris]EDL61151.1 hypothetical protein PM8797T_02949 [Gimesia maris DSM 8797]QEG15986.1 hypothetical protein GmarT_18470 [Gimesia maris]QGQ30755.1 hypothetical protein F1729_20085 [Gimesia maris]
MARLLSTVESNNSRELLYRLCVVIGLFGRIEIDSVASVSPKVNRPNEAYSHLQGLWIEKQTENTAFICPLIAQFGQDELEEDVKRTVANKLAELVFKSSGLSPIDFAKGISYFKLARNGPSLGMHLLSGLRKSFEFPEDWKKLIYQTSISEGLLDDCPTILALIIKAVQVHLAQSLNRSIRELLSEAGELIENSRKEDFWGVFIFAIQTASIVAKVDLSVGLDLCGFVLSNFEKVKEIEDYAEALPDSSPLFDDEYLSSFPWFFVPEIKNTDDFNNWFKLISDLPKEPASKIISCDLAKGGLQLLLDRLWIIQHQVSAKEQNFDDAIRSYDTVISYAKKNHFRWVQALAVRSKIIVYAEYLKDIKTATQLASDFLESEKNDDEILFLINHILGRQYLFNDKIIEASERLSIACELDADEFKDLKCHAFIELSRAIGDSDSSKALEKAESAVRIASQNPKVIHSKLMIRALGEASIAAWYNHNKSLAFDYLDEAFLVLFQHFEETTEWKMNSVLLAQVLGYMSSVSSTGFPPEESYIKPERGFLSIYNEELANWYDETMDVRTVALISYLLVVYSSSLGKHNRAIFWANRGIDDARKKSILPSIFLLGETLIASLIKKFQTEKVLDYASEAAIALTASMVASNKGIHSVLQNQNPLTLMGEKPNQNWNQAESLALFLGVLPTMLYISILEDDNKRKLESLVSYCTEQAEDSSDPNVFNSISAAIKCSFEEKPSFKLRDSAMKEYKAGNRAGATANFILASFSKETHLNAAVSYHALIMHEYSSKISTNSTLWLFLTDNLLLYWSRILEARKFSFSNHPYIEGCLSKINLLAPGKRAQNLIRILMDGLKVNLPSELELVSNWLYDAKEEI